MTVPAGATPANYEHVPSKDVSDFHKFSDLDGNNKSQHHTLGAGANQASPGNHSHDGGASQALVGIDTTMMIDNVSNQTINGVKTFTQPIAGTIQGGDAHTNALIAANPSGFAYATGGVQVHGGSEYGSGDVAVGGYANYYAYHGFANLISLVVTPSGTSRLTGAVISMGSPAMIQVGNFSGGAVGAGYYVNWVAVGT